MEQVALSRMAAATATGTSRRFMHDNIIRANPVAQSARDGKLVVQEA